MKLHDQYLSIENRADKYFLAGCVSFKSSPRAEVMFLTYFDDGKVKISSAWICLYNAGEIDCHIYDMASKDEEIRRPF